MKVNDSFRVADRQARYLLTPVVLPEIVWLADLAAIMLSALAAAAVFTAPWADPSRYAVYVAIAAAAYFLVARMADLYSLAVISNPFSRTDKVILAISAAVLIMLGVSLGLRAWDPRGWSWSAAFGGLAVVMLLSGRVLAWLGFRRLGERGVIGRGLMILGAGEQASRFLRRLRKTKPYFFSITGVYESVPGEAEGADQIEGTPVLGGVEDLLAHLRSQRTDDVVIALPWTAEAHVAATVERLKELPINVYISTDLIGFELAFRPAYGHYRELPMFEVMQRPISGWSAALKAIEDYTLSALVLLFISPLLLLIAAAIKTDSPGPVFFMQERLGFNNKVFKIYKFRSMYHNNIPESVVIQAQKGDPRITRVGRFIRSTSLDELPQLLNVLNGTMSLVGPRPHALSHNEEYGAQIRSYFARHRVKPGITGWAQVNGLRGETDILDKMEARIRHDLYYADNWSLLFDLRILFMTAFVTPFQKNAY